MLLTTTDGRQVQENLTGEVINVGIADMRIIIDRLTDMYADRETTCIREYSCNARDAHIEAGVDAPIEVSTPGPLQPYMTIRDYGVGLSLESIRTIFSQYGASTKRDTNEQTGAFGLGGKSGLAYSDQFTVTSVKDGVRVQAIMSRDPVRGVTMKVVDTSDTDEPNGTVIMIPARAHNDFQRKAAKFFSYWPEGTVKLNGAFPKFMPEGQKVTESVYINSGGYNQQSVAVMGGVPYPVTLNHGLGWGKSLTVFVPIGSMDIPGDREKVIDTDRTMATLRKAEEEFRTGLHDAVRKAVEGAKSPAEAATIKREWNASIGSQNMPANVSYKGKDVPDSYKVEFDITIAPMHGRRMNAHSSYRKDSYLPLPSVNGCVWVTGFDYVSFTATVKKKLDKWYQDNDMDVPTCYVLAATSQKPDMTWLENITFIDWPTVKAIKLPKNIRSTSTGRIPGSYDIWESGDYNEDTPADDIDTSTPLFWMVGRGYSGRKAAEYLHKSYPGATLVMMRDGRQDKFQRLFPSAKDAVKVIRDDFHKWEKNIDKDAAYALHARNNADSRLKALDMSRVNDPDIKAAVKMLDADTTVLQDEIAEWRQLGFYYDPTNDDGEFDECPLAKYPLLPESYYFTRFMRKDADAIYRYMNCEYAHHKAQKGS